MPIILIINLEIRVAQESKQTQELKKTSEKLDHLTVGSDAEGKRFTARRQILIAGAAGLPAILTFGRRQAYAADLSTCISIMGTVLPVPPGTATCRCILDPPGPCLPP